MSFPLNFSQLDSLLSHFHSPPPNSQPIRNMLEDNYENEFLTRKGENHIYDKNQNYVGNTEEINKNEKGIESNKEEIMNHFISEEQLEKRSGELSLSKEEKKEKNEEIYQNFLGFAENKDFIKKEEMLPKNLKGAVNEWISRIDLIIEGKMDYIEKKQIIWERESENDSNNDHEIENIFSLQFFKKPQEVSSIQYAFALNGDNQQKSFNIIRIIDEYEESLNPQKNEKKEKNLNLQTFDLKFHFSFHHKFYISQFILNEPIFNLPPSPPSSPPSSSSPLSFPLLLPHPQLLLPPINSTPSLLPNPSPFVSPSPSSILPSSSINPSSIPPPSDLFSSSSVLPAPFFPPSSLIPPQSSSSFPLPPTSPADFNLSNSELGNSPLPPCPQIERKLIFPESTPKPIFKENINLEKEITEFNSNLTPEKEVSTPVCFLEEKSNTPPAILPPSSLPSSLSPPKRFSNHNRSNSLDQHTSSISTVSPSKSTKRQKNSGAPSSSTFIPPPSSDLPPPFSITPLSSSLLPNILPSPSFLPPTSSLGREDSKKKRALEVWESFPRESKGEWARFWWGRGMTQILNQKTELVMKEGEVIKQKDMKFNQNLKKTQDDSKNEEKIGDNIKFQFKQANSIKLDTNEGNINFSKELSSSDKKEDITIFREKIRKSIIKENSNRLRRKTDSLPHSNPNKPNIINKRLFISNEIETPKKMAQRPISIEKERIKTFGKPDTKKNEGYLIKGAPVKEKSLEKAQNNNNKRNQAKFKKNEQNTQKSVDIKTNKIEKKIIRKSNEDKIDYSTDKGKKKISASNNITIKSFEKDQQKNNLKKNYTQENAANPSPHQIISSSSHQKTQKDTNPIKNSDKNAEKMSNMYNTIENTEKTEINKNNETKISEIECPEKSLLNENIQNIKDNNKKIGQSHEDLKIKSGDFEISNNFIQLDMEKQVELTYNDNPTPHNLLESEWSEEERFKNKEEEEEEIVLNDRTISMKNDDPVEVEEEEQIVLTDHKQDEINKVDADDIIYDNSTLNPMHPTPNQVIEEPNPNFQIIDQSLNKNYQTSIFEKKSITCKKEFIAQPSSGKSDASKGSKLETKFIIKNDKKLILKSNTPKSNESFNFQAKNFINLEDDDDGDELSLKDSPSPLLKNKMEDNFVSKNKVKAKSDFEFPREAHLNFGEMKKKPFASGNYKEKKGIFMVLRKDIASISQNKEDLLKLIIKSLK